MPLPLVSCYHSRKPRVLEVASPFTYGLYEDMIMDASVGVRDLAGGLNAARMMALENAGMDLEEVFLPSVSTGMNRLIVGHPGRTPIRCSSRDTDGVAGGGRAAEGQGGG